ncbi:hypothetical protein Q0P14_14205, partial [Staphylococcus aureus]|nr:hypothetical protein [Staphylococcus aureus]
SPAIYRDALGHTAVYGMPHGPKHPYRTQWIPCIVVQWIPIECSEFHAAGLNAVDSMERGLMHPD